MAMVAYDGQPERRMLRAQVEGVGGPRPCWIDHACRIFEDLGRVQYARRVVVIDAEDDEQAERFTHLFLSHHWSPDHQSRTDAGRAALREFIDPPEPAGPVVIDSEDDAEVRRLADALRDVMCNQGHEWDESRSREVHSHMRAALRRFSDTARG